MSHFNSFGVRKIFATRFKSLNQWPEPVKAAETSVVRFSVSYKVKFLYWAIRPSISDQKLVRTQHKKGHRKSQKCPIYLKYGDTKMACSEYLFYQCVLLYSVTDHFVVMGLVSLQMLVTQLSDICNSCLSFKSEWFS